MAVPEREGNLARFEFHYLVGTPEGIDHFTEMHKTGLFTPEEYREAFTRLGMEVSYDANWPTKRGLYIGVVP